MRRTVVWDDGCSFCATWVAWVRRLDWCGVHRFIGATDPAAYEGTGLTHAQTAEAVQLVWDDGYAAGFDAVRRILLRLPLTTLPALALWVPPAPWLGPRVYRRIAARRHCRYQPGGGDGCNGRSR